MPDLLVSYIAGGAMSRKGIGMEEATHSSLVADTGTGSD